MSKLSGVGDIDLVGAYLAVLREGFVEGKALDGTRVVRTPFKYVSGAQVKVAVWEEDGALWISDRGGLIEALRYELGYLFEEYLDAMFDRFEDGLYGVEFLGNTFLLQTTEGRLGQDVATLVFALLETQAQAGFWAADLWEDKDW